MDFSGQVVSGQRQRLATRAAGRHQGGAVRPGPRGSCAEFGRCAQVCPDGEGGEGVRLCEAGLFHANLLALYFARKLYFLLVYFQGKLTSDLSP